MEHALNSKTSAGTRRQPPRLAARLSLAPCPIGAKGDCCKACHLGPCRFFGDDPRGVCGASRDLIIARNLLRSVAAGTAAHCGHARHMLEFGGAPRQGDGVQFREISGALHQSAMGVGADPDDLLRRCLRLAALDGEHGLGLATRLEDAAFGRPAPKSGRLDLATLDPGRTNIAVHGHEPALAMALAAEAARHPDVNLVGVCCTGASLLAAAGVPLAAAFTLQEDVVATGIVEALVVDSQCVMPSLPDLCECFHTRLVSTSPLARMPGAVHMPVRTRAGAASTARAIIRLARGNRKNRSAAAHLAFRAAAPAPSEAVVGFTEDSVGLERLADGLRRGKLKGVIAAVGCVNPRSDAAGWTEAFRDLAADHAVLTTGCMAFELGRAGLLDGRNFFHLGSCVNNARAAAVFRRLAALLGRPVHALPFTASCPMPITEKSVAIGLYFATLGCRAHFGAPFPIPPSSGAAAALQRILKEDHSSQALLESSPAAFVRALRGRSRRGTARARSLI